MIIQDFDELVNREESDHLEFYTTSIIVGTDNQVTACMFSRKLG
jgi:hypothetical protein